MSELDGIAIKLPELGASGRIVTVHRSTRGMFDVPSYEQGFADGVASVPQPDPTPPVIEIVSPVPGVQPGQPGGFPKNRRLAERTPIVLRVRDLHPGLSYACIVVTIDGREEVVYRRGQFRGCHVLGSSQRTFEESGSTVLELTVRREGGWTGKHVAFGIDLVDGAGNVSS